MEPGYPLYLPFFICLTLSLSFSYFLVHFQNRSYFIYFRGLAIKRVKDKWNQTLPPTSLSLSPSHLFPSRDFRVTSRSPHLQLPWLRCEGSCSSSILPCTRFRRHPPPAPRAAMFTGGYREDVMHKHSLGDDGRSGNMGGVRSRGDF